MIRKITSVLLSSTILLASSCASIVSKSNYPIQINSTPSDSKITIVNKKGIEIYKGTTPANMKLSASNGFFSKAEYQVTFQKEGYAPKTVPVNFKFDGWYIGNLVFGGFIGLLIVDPATGAMFKLDTEFLNETLSESTVSVPNESIELYNLDEIPNSWKEHLVEIEK